MVSHVSCRTQLEGVYHDKKKVGNYFFFSEVDKNSWYQLIYIPDRKEILKYHRTCVTCIVCAAC